MDEILLDEDYPFDLEYFEDTKVEKKEKSLKDRIRNQGINTCPLCMINSKDIDYFLFLNTLEPESCNKIFNEMGFEVHLSENEILNHKTHLFIELDEEDDNKLKEIDDLNLLNQEILKIRKELKKLEKTNDNRDTQTYMVRNRLNNLLHLKSKFKEDEKENLSTKIDMRDLVLNVIKRELN